MDGLSNIPKFSKSVLIPAFLLSMLLIPLQSSAGYVNFPKMQQQQHSDKLEAKKAMSARDAVSMAKRDQQSLKTKALQSKKQLVKRELRSRT